MTDQMHGKTQFENSSNVDKLDFWHVNGSSLLPGRLAQLAEYSPVGQVHSLQLM